MGSSLKWSWEARRGALTEETTLHLWKEVTLLVAGGGFYPCLAMAQPIKATVLWSSNLFQWTVFNSSSQLPLLCKRGSPPLPQHTCTWFIVVAGPKLQSLLLLNKFIWRVKLLVVLLFLVNNYCYLQCWKLKQINFSKAYFSIHLKIMTMDIVCVINIWVVMKVVLPPWSFWDEA